MKTIVTQQVKKNLTILEGCGRALLLLFGGGKERVLSTFKFKQSLRTDLLYNVLNLLAMPAWKRSDQLQDFQLDIFVSLKDVFSQLNDYTGNSNGYKNPIPIKLVCWLAINGHCCFLYNMFRVVSVSISV